MAITIDELLKTPFSQRTMEEKIKIISQKKPRPPLPLNIKDENGILRDIDLSTEVYDQITWLTACEEKKTVFCWPCLLMMPQNDWNSGISDIKYAIDKHKEHEQEPAHLEGVLKYNMFVFDKFKNPSAMLNTESNKNSFYDDANNVLRHLIESICYAIQMTDSKVSKYASNKLEVGEAVKYLKLLKPNIFFADSLVDVLIKSPKVINGMVDAITVTLKVAIEKEIKEASYVSIILSEHVLNKKNSQMSTILRYIKNGEVCERFVGFTNLVGFRLQHKDVAEHILRVQKEYHCQDKILSLSVDGAVLQAPELSQLFDIYKFPCKYFVPCYFQEFGHVLMQSVAQLEDCGLFFKTLSAIQSYFEIKDNFRKLQRVILSENPQLKKYKWYTKAPFITFLNVYRKHFLIYFDHEQTSSKYLSGADRIKIIAFKVFLENLKTIFLLKIFGKLFLNYLGKNLNFVSNIFNKNFDKDLIKFKSNVEKLQKDGCTELWIEAVEEKTGEKALESAEVTAMNNSEKKSYIALFEKILNQIMKELKFRQKDVLSLRFCNLLLQYNTAGTLVFEERLVSLLYYEQSRDFDKDTLYSEMAVVKGDPKLLLKNKALYDLLGTNNDYNLSSIFPQLHRLGTLILTIPVLPPAEDWDFKNMKLKEIKNFSYIPEDKHMPSGETSILCIEKRMLKDLQCSKNFYEDVIKKYHLMQKMGWIK